MEHLQSKQASEHGANVLSACIEQMAYRDRSRITPEEVRREVGILPETFAFASSDLSFSKEPPFPLKLHRILSDQGLEGAIAWLPHGRAWRIVDSKELERNVLPRHFKHSQIKSFMRQVTGWGFRRVSIGKDEGAYYQECFLRGLPHVCLKMRRVSGTRSKFRSKMMCVTPDFYELTQKHPLPGVDGNWPPGAKSADQVSTSNSANYRLETQPQHGNSNLGSVLGGNISLPQHLLGIAQPPMGWLPNNPLAQSSPNVSLDVASLMHRLNSMQGLQSNGALNDILSSSMHGQAGSGLTQQQLLQHLLQQPSNAGNFQSLQHLFQQPASVRSIPTVQSMATHLHPTSQTTQGQLPQMQSMELPSTASQAATAASRQSPATRSESEGNVAKEQIQESQKSFQPSRGRDESPDTSSLRRTFLSRPEFGETNSQSSSSAGLNESGSESSTDSPARTGEEQDSNDFALSTNEGKREKEAGSALFLLSRCSKQRRGSESVRSSSSVSMSETGSDGSGPQPSESSGGESSNSKQGNAPHDGVLHRHRSSRPKALDLTRQASSSVLTGLSELGSDGSEKRPEPSTTLRKSPMPKEPNIDQASDQSSDSADGSEASSESLRKLWDLISSADESKTNNASNLVKASRGLVGALIGYDSNNNPLSDCSTESNTTSAPLSTETAKMKGGSEEAKTQSNATPTAPSSLDVAAKAMTLGILWGMKRSGSTPVATSSSGSTSRSGGPGSSSNLEEVENEMKAFLSNPSMRLSIAQAQNGQEIQVQGPCSDDAGSDELRPSSVSGSSDDEDAKKRQNKKHHEDAVRTAKLGKSEERQKRSTSAFELPTEVAWSHKRKATHSASYTNSGPDPSAKRRSVARLSPKPGPMPVTGGVDAKAAASGREKFGTTRSVSSLTTPLSDLSRISTSNLKTLDKQNGLGASAPGSNSITSSQASDVSGEDFETVSDQYGSASSNNDYPTTNISGVFSGSTSNPAGSSTESSESTSGDEVAACRRHDSGNKPPLTSGLEKKKKATEPVEPAKKRARFALT